MTWQNRLRQAAYTSPSGRRIVFDFTDVSLVITKKSAAFDFPNADGTYIQDLGQAGRRYPLRVFLAGENYDFRASDLEDILQEQGSGTLEHPIYGVVEVVPFGEVKRRDDFVTGPGQAVFDIEFWETTGIVYPTSSFDFITSIFDQISEFVQGAATQFQRVTSLATALEFTTLVSKYERLLFDVRSALAPIAALQPDTRAQYDTIESSILRSLEAQAAAAAGQVIDAETLAAQTQQLIQVAAYTQVSVEARIEAYSSLVQAVIARTGIVVASADADNANEFHAADQFVSGAVTGAALVTINAPTEDDPAQATAGFATKRQAITAADSLLTLFEAAAAWRDDNFVSLTNTTTPESSTRDIGEQLESVTDTGELYGTMQQTVAEAAGRLVAQSFSLKQEKTLTLTEARALVSLCAELYGEVDGKLDFFINSNNFSGSEILEVPRGRNVLYYV